MSRFIKAAGFAALSALFVFVSWEWLVILGRLISPRWGVAIVGAVDFLLVAIFILAAKKRLLVTVKAVWHWRERLSVLGLAYVFDYFVNWTFNYPLYSYVISNWGTLVGGGIMIVLSFLICWIYLVVYDILKKDIFGIEMAKEFIEEWKEYDGDSWWRNLVASQLNRWGEAGIFVLLSLAKDPFFTVAGCRRGVAEYNGLSGRDWRIFLGSVFLGNVPWIIFIGTGVWIWEFGIDEAWPYIDSGFSWIILQLPSWFN